jgi:hypothetical protein
VLAALLLVLGGGDIGGHDVTAPSVPHVEVVVRNDLAFARPSETIELPASELGSLGPIDSIHVFDGQRELTAQTLDIDGRESLVFQSDVPAKGSKTFALRAGTARKYRKEDFRVYGRFVRERFDDFAWENDRVAHRMYGAALETWEKEPLTSSAVDIWLKRTRKLVVNDWYMTDDYHRDNGDGADFYSAGKSRGCGGDGLWSDGKLVVSSNFRNSRVLAAGPIRLVFELDYPNFETKRVTLDAGQYFNRFESRFSDKGPAYAAGIKKFKDTDVRTEKNAGWIRAWGPVTNGTGRFACTLALDPSTITEVTEDQLNHLVVARQPAIYYVGTAWDQAGDFTTVADWDRYVDRFVQRLRSPLRFEFQKQKAESRKQK